MARYDILPSRDMQKVKKDLKDIKKKLSKKKTQIKRRQSFKVLPHKDVVVVKKDISDIKRTLEKKTIRGKPQPQLVRVTRFDNYYDMLPHKRIKQLELQLTSLRDKLRKKRDKAEVKKSRKNLLPRSTRQLLNSMNRLNTSITSMLHLFEKADEMLKTAEIAPEIVTTPSGTADLSPLVNELGEIKSRLEELSAENEEMAKGILVIAEMLKENPPANKSESQKSGDISFDFVPKPEAPKPEDIPPMGSPFEPFYPQPGPAIPPAKEGQDRRRLNQF
jgi:hypothetical protein